MAELTGGSGRVDLGRGYSIIAPGVRGRAELRDPASNTRSVDAGTDLLNDALLRTDMTPVATVDLATTPAAGDQSRAVMRDARGDDALVLEVPDLGPGAGQVVLLTDEAGALSWHFPVATDAPPSQADRGAGSTKRFVIPNRIGPTVAGRGERSLVGAVGRKLLKVIVYPITDALIGKSATWIANHWESRNRAYGLRSFTPENYRQATREPQDRDAVALKSADLAQLAKGPALLFVHGTFSTANSAFHDLPPELLIELHRRYEGRVFAFNHFSLAHDPARNVIELSQALQALAAGTTLNVDIVCHSRGGLVARSIAGAKDADPAFPLLVRRIVFVGVPNQGTLLAQPDHMVEMIDRLTTLVNLIPSGGVADLLDGILIAVKIIGHGALKGLDGLSAMNPAGSFLAGMNRAGTHGPEYFAIAADYEPADPGLRGLVSTGIDSALDRVFESAKNDLVVPEGGVHDSNGGFGFPIAAERCLLIPASAGIMHTGMFGHPPAADRLRQWLN